MQLQLVLALSVRAQSQAGGVSKINAYINVLDVFATQVLPEIQVRGGNGARPTPSASGCVENSWFSFCTLCSFCAFCAFCTLFFALCALQFARCVSYVRFFIVRLGFCCLYYSQSSLRSRFVFVLFSFCACEFAVYICNALRAFRFAC